MEYEIRDDPQGLEERDHANRDGGLVEDHVALERQRSTREAGYREQDLRSTYSGAPLQAE